MINKGKTRYGYIAKTDMSDKAIRKAKSNLKAKVKNIQKHTTSQNINNYNLAIMGIQNYYCIATNVYNNLTDVNYALLPTIRVRLKNISHTQLFREMSDEFKLKATGIRSETKIVVIGKMPLLPVTAVHHKSPMNFSQDITNYTAKGREKIHKQIECISQGDFIEIARIRDPSETIEFNDNMMSAYAVQQGNCYISGIKLMKDNIVCMRKKPRERGGMDSHGNIAFMEKSIGKIITTENVETAKKLLEKYTLDSLQRNRLNRLRNNYGYHAI